MRCLGVIPARYHSSRLPGKPLVDLNGKPMIEWVYRRAAAARSLERLLVATDDERVRAAVERFGGEAVMTRPEHASGTDRVAEVAARIAADLYVNIQGDEPLISPRTIDALCEAMRRAGDSVQVATAQVPLEEPGEAASPHVVKVVADQRGRALYFSRALIPFRADGGLSAHKHLGIYAYRRRLLLELDRLRPSALERCERLEQLRFLDNGIAIHVETVSEDSVGVDTPEDVERVIPLLENDGAMRVRAGEKANQEGG